MSRTPDLRTASGLLALQRLPRVGPTTALKAALRGSLPAGKPTEPLVEGDIVGAFEWAEAELERQHAAGVEAIAFFDRRYPRLLSGIADPPPVLYAKGNLALLANERLVAVVGTRAPSAFGETAARALTVALAEAGWGIVSGLAIGIDSIAHRTALEVGAPTVAVLGNGLDRVYPKANEQLADEILGSNGLVVSEQPFGAPPIPRNLIARDRIQSGLAAAVVVVQTGVKGGTMHTARFAAEQGRPIFCPVPHGENGKSDGLRVLLEQPARNLCQLLPAWHQARNLCARLGQRPVAVPIEKARLPEFLDQLELAQQRDRESEQQSLLIPETEA
jgi:DNA processing protein